MKVAGRAGNLDTDQNEEQRSRLESNNDSFNNESGFFAGSGKN